MIEPLSYDARIESICSIVENIELPMSLIKKLQKNHHGAVDFRPLIVNL